MSFSKQLLDIWAFIVFQMGKGAGQAGDCTICIASYLSANRVELSTFAISLQISFNVGDTLDFSTSIGVYGKEVHTFAYFVPFDSGSTLGVAVVVFVVPMSGLLSLVKTHIFFVVNMNDALT